MGGGGLNEHDPAHHTAGTAIFQNPGRGGAGLGGLHTRTAPPPPPKGLVLPRSGLSATLQWARRTAAVPLPQHAATVRGGGAACYRTPPPGL